MSPQIQKEHSVENIKYKREECKMSLETHKKPLLPKSTENVLWNRRDFNENIKKKDFKCLVWCSMSLKFTRYLQYK